VVATVLLGVAASGLLAGCAQEENSTGPFTPTQSAQSPGWVSSDKAVAIAIDEFGGTFESVTERPAKGQPAWQVALTGTDAGSDLVVSVAQKDGTILGHRPL
jgi:hypothetical protein